MRASEAIPRENQASGAALPAVARRVAGVQPRGRAPALGVVVLVVGSCLLWLPYLDVPLHVDAAGYATAAYWWARGDTLYRDITITRPQGIFVLFRAIEALGLGSIRGIHACAAAYTACCALALLAVAGRVWDRRVGLGAAALFSMIMATPHMQGYIADAELFMLLPLLGGLYLLLRADEHPLGGRMNLALIGGCGLLGAVALLLKPSGVVALPLAALWLLRRRWTERAPWRAWLGAGFVLGLGFALGLVPALMHGLLTAPDVYLRAVFTNRLNQDSALAASLGYQSHRLVHNSTAIVVRLPILLLAPLGLWAAQRGGDKRARDLLWLWLASSFAGAALGGNWYLHYFQQLLPPLAVAVALGLRALAHRPRRVTDAALHGLALAGLVALALSIVPLFIQGADPRSLPEYEPSVSAAGPVAAYLREHTDPGESIYVAYDRADIYYLSGRYPAARWLYFRELKWTPGAFAEQVARLADPATAPRYVVAAQTFDDYDFDADGALRAVVARDYTLETTIEGVPLFRHK